MNSVENTESEMSVEDKNLKKMKTYYSSIKNKVNANTHGWAASYYGVVAKFINENNIKSCAEIGIGYGLHAKNILENSKIEKLYLIDPMRPYGDVFSNDITKNGGFEALIVQIKNKLLPFTDRYTFFRKPSLEVTENEIPNESLDLVFIDGDHSYDAVCKDLRFWWNKINVGGYILGDDYTQVHRGTIKAVDEFTKEYNLEMNILHKEGSTHPIYMFQKLKSF
jgi:hypothetical protein